MLKSIYDVDNFDEINEELIELFKQFDKELNNYDTDVYLYYDEDNNTARLDTFQNPGGNSWLDDDHYCIYTDKQHYDDFMDWYNGDIKYISDILNKTVDELYKETAYVEDIDEEDIEDFDVLNDNDVIEYIESVEQYMDTLYEEYCNTIDSGEYEDCYRERAHNVWERFDDLILS